MRNSAAASDAQRSEQKVSSCLNHNKKSAKMFVHELGIRTQLVSGNWLRTFCSDCPEENSGGAALQLIANAI